MRRTLLTAASLTGIFALGACSETTMEPMGSEMSMAAEAANNRPDFAGPKNDNGTIAEIAEREGFTLLLAAVNYIAENNPESELVAGLLNKDQYTVFAPTDDAFGNLVAAVQPLLDPDVLADEGPFAAIDDLLGRGTIEAVVSYHVTDGRRASNSVLPKNGDRMIETLLEGATFSVDSDGMITAVGNSAMITGPDVSASNGIIHVINAVILPVDLGL